MVKNKKPKHIAVAGNIGAGKTTLTEMLSKHYRWIPQFEDVDHNPYLNDFYEDMPRWSFNLQIFFLNSRLNQLLEIHTGTETVIQDRTIYEGLQQLFPVLPDPEADGPAAGPADLSPGVGAHAGGADTKTWEGV
jgi:deoxyadenosine/deoxycytidine kinase